MLALDLKIVASLPKSGVNAVDQGEKHDNRAAEVK